MMSHCIVLVNSFYLWCLVHEQAVAVVALSIDHLIGVKQPSDLYSIMKLAFGVMPWHFYIMRRIMILGVVDSI